jgi:TonB family protein
MAVLVLLPSSLFARFHHALPNLPAVSAADSPVVDRSVYDPSDDAPRVSAVKTGRLPTKDGLCLRISTDLGDLHILTDASQEVSYRVSLESESHDPNTENILREFSLVARKVPTGISIEGHAPRHVIPGRLQVSFYIHVPLNYCLDINTMGGNIDVQNIEGPVSLATAGGNITVGRVGAGDPRKRPLVGGSHASSDAFSVKVEPASKTAGRTAARLETQGGHITIGDVAGDLRATTAGGHITVGNIEGDATLRTGGGHIETGRVAGVSTLDTGGGNIHVASAGSSITASTGGGLIDLGDAAGAIRANTGGGAVRIEHISGPAAVVASGGSVFLRQVNAPLRVSAATGGITAWFNDVEPESAVVAHGIRRGRGSSQLTTGEGDITVYLPRKLALTVDALVEQGAEHRIVTDPSLPLKVSYQDSPSGVRAVHCEGDLNGGGDVLHLKAVSGNIVLRLGDSDSRSSGAISEPGMHIFPGLPPQPDWNSHDQGDWNDFDREGFIEEIHRRIQESWRGVVPIDAGELQKHLEQSIAPIYPEVARKAGIEGDITLRAYVSSEGRVTDLKVLGGPPILAHAAIDAVQQWRYQPMRINGRPANVVTTLVVAFRLQ